MRAIGKPRFTKRHSKDTVVVPPRQVGAHHRRTVVSAAAGDDLAPPGLPSGLLYHPRHLDCGIVGL